ncbi:MAG: phosphate ABC transporter substrate-binding protein [Gammaproteobacteria bacterium]|nr:phosphate ABC transporter substrate-binding protein [Gammaproteobacteria bacterium]MDE2251159.1 phosphate ABC transporter substrate-binding protein [Gammaproteobacteria bacterium]
MRRPGPRPGAWLFAVLLAGASGAATTADLYVVCNANVALQSSDVRDVFIGEKSFAGSARLAPADNLAAQAIFLQRVVKVGIDRYTSLWTKKSFRDGANPPPVKASDAETIAYVRQTPGACSYVQAPPPAGVNVVAKF